MLDELTPQQNPLTVPMLNQQAQVVKKPLRDSVSVSVRSFLKECGQGEDPTEFYELVLCEIERPLLDQVMQHTRGNQTRAAALLGINRGTLRKKLKKYGMG